MIPAREGKNGRGGEGPSKAKWQAVKDRFRRPVQHLCAIAATARHHPPDQRLTSAAQDIQMHRAGGCKGKEKRGYAHCVTP